MGGSVLKIGFLDFGEYFRGIPQFFSQTKTEVYTAQLSTDSSIGERAAVLKNFLETTLKGRKVNIIGHSLGGLDARYLVSILKSNQVASITTIGTPHGGSPLSDWGMRQVKEKSLWYRFFRLVGFDLAMRRFLPEITTSFLREKFNPKVRDMPQVKYFSVRSYADYGNGTMSWYLWFPFHWLAKEPTFLPGDKQDGLVPLSSQGWGEVLATVELDHLGQMNHHEGRRSMERDSLTVYALIYDRLLGEGL